MQNSSSSRVVILRSEQNGPDSRNLRAHLDGSGNLHIEGQDLGPATAIVSTDGEYEWGRTIQRENLPDLIALLDGSPEDHILDLLERNWTGKRAGELERRLSESAIPSNVWTWSG
jgi:hypothetical protein